MAINLNALVEDMQSTPDEWIIAICLDSSDIFTISDEALAIAEDNSNDFPAWQKEEIEIARRYLNNPHKFIICPSQYDVNECKMMRNFAFSLGDNTQQEKLLNCLSNKGAFRRFKNAVALLGIDQEWYQYKNEKYKEFMLDWCEANELTTSD